MKVFTYIWIFGAGIFCSCHPNHQISTSGERPESTHLPGKVASHQRTARFAIRDLSVTDISKGDSASYHQLRATLVALDEQEKSGTIIVYLVADINTENEDFKHPNFEIHMRDGIGTISSESFSYPKTNTKPRYENWRVRGFVRLEEGSIINE